jgi:hypothetical protein
MSSAVRPSHPFAPWWKLIDWRLVAAAGLPLWAFVFGMIVAWRPAAPPPPAEPPAAAAVSPAPLPPPPAPPEPVVVEAPPPRVVKPEPVVLTVPVIVPTVPLDPPADEFKLPDAEVVAAADKCQTFDTKIRFHRGLPEAAEQAKVSKKLLFVLHISGHFDDPGFT